jgi:hypothetical protein
MISRGVILAGLAVLLLAGLYFALRNSSAGPPPAQPQARAYHLSIEGKRVVSGPELIAATEGDTVTLYVTADRAAMMEIHGYGQEIALEPGREVALSFAADRAGRFGIDLHGEHGHLKVAALEVEPR